jgi:hypothetical protein
VDLDDRHTAEVADVGNLDLGRSCHVDVFLDRRGGIGAGRWMWAAGRWRLGAAAAAPSRW